MFNGNLMKMAKNMELLLAALLVLAAVYEARAVEQHLQCWHCSSDTIGAEHFCGTEFKEPNIPVDPLKERNISIVRSCNSTINSEHERAVCRKTVEEMNGKTITKRFCYYTNKSDPLDHCSHEATEKNVRRIFCQDCLSDKCNGASSLAATFAVVTLAVTLALLSAKTLVI